MKCTWEHYSKGCNGYVKREKCCGVVKNCIGTNCQHVKGQCKFAGKEKHVFPTKKIDQHSFDEKKPEEHKRAHKKHIHKSGKKDFEIVKRVHRASCKGEYKCIVKRLKNKFNAYRGLHRKSKFLPKNILRRMKFLKEAQDAFARRLVSIKRLPLSETRKRRRIEKQIIKIDKSLYNGASFLSKKRRGNFRRSLRKYTFQGKVTRQVERRTGEEEKRSEEHKEEHKEHREEERKKKKKKERKQL